MFRQLLLLLIVFAGQSVLADPTRPPAWVKEIPTQEKEVADPETYQLQQILISDSRRLAIINGEVVATGEKLAGAQVIKIDTDMVVIKIGSQRKKLRLSPETKEVVNAQ